MEDTIKRTVEEQRERNARAIALLDSWAHASEEEIAEQRETWAALKTALDEDRPFPARKLFPEHEVEEHEQPAEESR